MSTPFSTDPREAARLYLARGFQPIPLDGRTKRVTRSGWPDERHTDADAERFAGRNLGLLLGPVSGGLTDVDLDCDEAGQPSAQVCGRSRGTRSGHEAQ